MDSALDDRLRALRDALGKMGGVAVAFSGGVDSTLLLDIAHEVLGERAIGLTVASAFCPEAEMAEAAEFCAARGIEHVLVDVDPLGDERIAANPPNRCYICKRTLFERMTAEAEARGLVLVEGTNTDDLGDYRPGLTALRELGVASPLLQAGLSKADIRALSRERGLGTADKPSAACLASRIPYGTAIRPEALAMVDSAERALRERGLSSLRVRAHGEPGSALARIEVGPADIARAAADAAGIASDLHGLGFAYVTLDLDGYRMGSLNEVLGM